jgi:hypothetical protein
VIIWGAEFDESLARFEQWLSESPARETQINEAINDISVYRKYRLSMLGPIRDDEKFYDVNNLLTLVFESLKTGNTDEDLALAAYLCYRSSDLFNRNMTIGDLNKFAPFYTTYSRINTGMRDTAVQYFSYWIAYGIGIVTAPPDDNFVIDPPTKALRSRLKYNFSPDETFFPKLALKFDAETANRLNQAIEKVRQDTSKPISDQDLDRLIKRQAQVVGAPVYTSLAIDQTQVAELFVEKAPKTTNLHFLRFFVYAAGITAVLIIKKWRLPVFSVIGLFEAVLLFITNNQLLSDIEGFFYGILTFSMLGFAIILWLSRLLDKKRRGLREWVNLFMFVVLAILWFFPYWVSPEELKMDQQQGFYKTAGYTVLSEELFLWKRGYYEQPFVAYLSSRESPEEYASILQKRLDHAIPFSGVQLREDTKNYLDQKWKNANYQSMQSSVSSAFSDISQKEAVSPNFYLYQSLNGSYALLVMTLITAVVIVFRFKKRLFLFLYVSSWIPFFIQTFLPKVSLWVEKGYPILTISSNHPNILVLLSSIVLFCVIVFYSWKTFQKEG